MSVAAYRALWSIPNAGPAVSTFHFAPGDDTTMDEVSVAVRGFLLALQSAIPNEVTISFDTEATRYDAATGELLEVISVAPPTQFVGSATGNWSAGSGLRCVWGTGAIKNGRRVRGSTFIVPVHSASFGTGGYVQAGTITTVNTAATAFVGQAANSGSPLVVWSRPVDGAGGTVHLVQNGTCSSIPGTLRSRKY